MFLHTGWLYNTEWWNTQNMKWRKGGKSSQILKDGMSPLILKNIKNCKQRRIKKIIIGYIKTSLWNRWCNNWKMAQELHNNNDISVFLSILHKIHRIKHSTSEPLFNAHISPFKLRELVPWNRLPSSHDNQTCKFMWQLRHLSRSWDQIRG